MSIMAIVGGAVAAGQGATAAIEPSLAAVPC